MCIIEITFASICPKMSYSCSTYRECGGWGTNFVLISILIEIITKLGYVIFGRPWGGGGGGE